MLLQAKMATNGTDSSGLPTDTRSGTLIAILCIVVPLTTFVVGCRFYTRYFISNTFGADDWVTLISLVSSREIPLYSGSRSLA